MNTELNNRWRHALRPFDGPVLVASDLTASDLLVVVRLALESLRGAHVESALFVNEDWHDHDGFISPARSISWIEAISWTAGIDQLRSSCSDDWRVHTLLFSGDVAFCLRYWLGDETECTFDLCAPREMLERLSSSPQLCGLPLNFEPSAKLYLDRRWGGVTGVTWPRTARPIPSRPRRLVPPKRWGPVNSSAHDLRRPSAGVSRLRPPVLRRPRPPFPHPATSPPSPPASSSRSPPAAPVSWCLPRPTTPQAESRVPPEASARPDCSAHAPS